MIEIKKRNQNWELYVDSSLLGWDEDLSVVVNFLQRHIEIIEGKMFENAHDY